MPLLGKEAAALRDGDAAAYIVEAQPEDLEEVQQQPAEAAFQPIGRRGRMLQRCDDEQLQQEGADAAVVRVG